MASVSRASTHPPLYLEPTEVYHLADHADVPIKLRIATGGAGQSGLIRALAIAFIKHHVSERAVEPFAIAWCASDTSLSFNSLALRGADMAITYHTVAEQTALQQGIADRWEYAWRDHWMLVGPKSNPANLPTTSNTSTNAASIQALFVQLFCAAVTTATSSSPVRFLSRYDKSAANIKESALWASIGQTPWSEPYSHWYHRFVAFPYQALEAAAKLGEYTLCDKGSWLGVEQWVRDGMIVFVEGGDGDDDQMLNPAHALVGVDGVNKAMANAFVDWMIDESGGQEVIRNFASKDGTLLYSPAPPRSRTLESPSTATL